MSRPSPWLSLAALVFCIVCATGSAELTTGRHGGGGRQRADGAAAAAAAARRRLRLRLLRGSGAAPGSNSTVRAAIAYGLRAREGDFPWIASPITGDYYLGCGAALIRPRLVVTAAHCVVTFNRKSKKMKPVTLTDVQIGSVDLFEDDFDTYDIVPVSTTIRHPRYNPLDSAFDIALIVLSEPSFIAPVKLAPAGLKLRVGEGLFTAGWGDTQSQSSGDISALTYAVVPYITTRKCNAAMWGYSPTPKTHFCAGLGKNKQDTCQGDSGGPISRGKGAGATLVGVVSYGPDLACGEGMNTLNVGGYTSIMAMRPWIDAQIRALRV